MSKDEVIKKLTPVIDNLLNNSDLDAALAKFREFKIPDRFMADVLLNILMHIFNNKNASKYLRTQIINSEMKSK